MSKKLPPHIIEFLKANPYPSLSFMPFGESEETSQIAFFYQDEGNLLKKFEGNVKNEIAFYEEPHAYIMRMTCYLEETIEIKSKNDVRTVMNIETQVIETEFFKCESGIFALKRLATQNEFEMV